MKSRLASPTAPTYGFFRGLSGEPVRRHALGILRWREGLEGTAIAGTFANELFQRHLIPSEVCCFPELLDGLSQAQATQSGEPDRAF